MSCRILKTNVLASVLALSVLSVACDGPTRPGDPIPTPTPTPTPVVELNYTISGAVTEMTEGGLMPVEGMRVVVPSTLLWTMTDANGFYSIPGIRTRDGFILVSKDGYVTATSRFESTSDTRLDIRVARIAYYTLSGMAYEQTPTGRVPIAGIVLYCDGCGALDGHTFVTTDADGLYSFGWVLPGTTNIIIDGKEGYRYVGHGSNGGTVSIATPGDTRFDFEFVRR